MICLAGLALAKMKISILALASVQALEMPTKDGSFVKVNGKLIVHSLWTIGQTWRFPGLNRIYSIDGHCQYRQKNRPGYPARPRGGLNRYSNLTSVIDKDTKASLKGKRTYKELEDLAVKMFNDDVIIKIHKGENYFTKESWTQEVNL